MSGAPVAAVEGRRTISLAAALEWVVLCAVAASVSALAGRALFLGSAGYYLLPFDARPGHPLHDTLRPGGSLGLLLGVVGTALMIAMQLYTVRKWLPLQWPLGTPAWWLRFHILCGLTGPLLIVLHVGFYRPAGLVAVAFWCMLLVSASGVFGRYVYGHFPRSAAGAEMSLRATSARIRDLKAELVAWTERVDADRIGEAVKLAGDLDTVRGLPGLVKLDVAIRLRKRRIRRVLAGAGLPDAAERAARSALFDELRLKRAISTTKVSQRLFRYWHLFHEPLARAMYLIVGWHVFSAVVFGGALEMLTRGIP